MTSDRYLSRRELLASTGAGAAGLAGCLDNGDDTGPVNVSDDTADDTPPNGDSPDNGEENNGEENGDSNGAAFIGPEVETDSDEVNLPAEESKTVTVGYDAGSSDSTIVVTLEGTEQDVGRLVEEHLEGGEERNIELALEHEEIFTQNGPGEYDLIAQIEASSPPGEVAEDQYTDTQSVPLTVEDTPFNPEFDIDSLPEQVLPGSEINLETLLEGEYSEAAVEIDGEVYDLGDTFEAGEEGEHEIKVTAEGTYGEQTESRSGVINLGVPEIDQQENLERRQEIWNNMLWEEDRVTGYTRAIDIEALRQLGTKLDENLTSSLSWRGLEFINSEEIWGQGINYLVKPDVEVENMNLYFLKKGRNENEPEELISSNGKLEKNTPGPDIYSVEGYDGQEFFVFYEPESGVLGWSEEIDPAVKMVDFVDQGEGESFADNLDYVGSDPFEQNIVIQEAYDSDLRAGAYGGSTVSRAGEESVVTHEITGEELEEAIRTSDLEWGTDRSLPRDLTGVVNDVP